MKRDEFGTAITVADARSIKHDAGRSRRTANSGPKRPVRFAAYLRQPHRVRVMVRA